VVFHARHKKSEEKSMNRWLMGSVLGLGAVVLVWSDPEPVAAQKNPPGWLNNYTQAKAQAQQSGKPMMIVFR
jgi:hypothetical protein